MEGEPTTLESHRLASLAEAASFGSVAYYLGAWCPKDLRGRRVVENLVERQLKVNLRWPAIQVTIYIYVHTYTMYTTMYIYIL